MFSCGGLFEEVIPVIGEVIANIRQSRGRGKKSYEPRITVSKEKWT